MPIVAKPFNTPQRRFRLDDEVSESDHLSPHTFPDLKSRGFIVEKAEAKPAEAPLSFGKRPVAPSAPAESD